MAEFKPPGESDSSQIAPGIPVEMLAAWQEASSNAAQAIEGLNETAAQIQPSIALTSQMIELADSAMDRIGPLLAQAVRSSPDTGASRDLIEGLANRFDGLFRRIQPFVPVLDRLPQVNGSELASLLNDLRNEVRA